MVNRTIVALATPRGESGLAVIRISGPEAISVARKVFSGFGKASDIQSHHAVYGILRGVSVGNTTSSDLGHSIDEVVALPMISPRSYTGEDTVEFFCHGGRYITDTILGACRVAGAFPASPGEFSQQAFLNGKLSLNQTEAVADLIHADNEHAARAALKQLRGGLNSELQSIEDPLLLLLSELEGSLEFAEEEDVSVSLSHISGILNEAVKTMDRLLALVPAGRLLRDGVQIVLAGPPNVGKSSLFNALLEEERAIVDDEAGTTRDIVSGRIYHNKNLFVFHDTAGLRDEAGRVEQMGIKLTHRSINDADIVLWLTDSRDQNHGAKEMMEESDTEFIEVFTKCDLLPESNIGSKSAGIIYTSSKTKSGLRELWDELDESVLKFGIDKSVGMGIILNERHKHKIQQSRNDLVSLQNEVQALLENDLEFGGEEIVATMLSSILSGLGEISGRVFSEQLLASVFQRFCVGK